MKTLLIATTLLATLTANAELKPMENEEMGEIMAQGIQVDLSGSYSYDAIKVNDVVYDGQTVNFDAMEPVILDGNMMDATAAIGMINMLMPTSAGVVDTTGNGVGDTSAMMLGMPGIGAGINGANAISLSNDDILTNYNNQMFMTPRGLVILDAPLANDVPTTSGIPIIRGENLF